MKIVAILERLAFKLRSLALYFELKHYIVHNESYLKHVYTWNRAIGKSYNLIKLALKYDIPIFVPTNAAKSHLKGIAENHFKRSGKHLRVIIANDAARGYRFDVVLLDEGISEEMLNIVINPCCKCAVGYKAIY